MLMLKPLSILDRLINLVLKFPLFSIFVPQFLKFFLIKLVVTVKVYYIGFWCCFKQLFWWKKLDRPYLELDSNRQPLAIVTGATSGLGLALCELLAPKWRLIMIGRDRRRGQSAIDRLKKRRGNGCKLIFYSVDLSSRKSINEFLEIFIKTFDRLHLLVNNAGVMMTPYQPVGASGDIELQWAVNFLAPVYLTDRLAPCLRRARELDGFARVVNVSSKVLYAASLSPEYFACAGGCNGSPQRYSAHLAYANSKFALALYTKERADKGGDKGIDRLISLGERIDNGSRLIRNLLGDNGDRVDKENDELIRGDKKKEAGDNVITCSMHPGVIGTDLYQHTNVVMKWFMTGGCPLITGRVVLTPKQAADDLLWTCLSSAVESGGFYENGSRLPLPTVKEDVKSAMWNHLERQDIVLKSGL